MGRPASEAAAKERWEVEGNSGQDQSMGEAQNWEAESVGKEHFVEQKVARGLVVETAERAAEVASEIMVEMVQAAVRMNFQIDHLE